jgi:CubicO group peptidase (beta-lactamase class C family)
MGEIMSGYVERGELPGLVLLVSRRGEVHVEAIGAKSEGGEPIRRDTIFRIASMTKPVAAAAAMILVEECKLRLDEPVDRLLPELASRRVLKSLDANLDQTVPAIRPITPRDLLTLRMGIGYVMAPGHHPIQKLLKEYNLLQGPPNPQTQPNGDEWMRRVGTLPLMYQPGERWMYDLGLDVLGILITRASGKPLGQFLHERIFEPLGMKDTSFSVPAEKLSRFSTSYWTNPASNRLELFDDAGGQWSKPALMDAAASGLVSTIDDYLAFGQMMLNKGGHKSERILSRASVETMTTDQLTPAQKAVSGLVPGYFDSHGWGFGVSVVTRRDVVSAPIGQYGWDGGLGTSWRSDPQEELVGILMTQSAWTSPTPPPVFQDFWTCAYAAIED